MPFSTTLSYRKKNLYLVIACLLSAILVYFLAIKRTLVLKDMTAQLEQKVASGNEINQLKAKWKALGSRLKAGEKEEGGRLIEAVSNLCQEKQLRLHSFPKPDIHHVAGLDIATSRFVVEGDYRNLLELLYELEKSVSSGKVASIAFTVSDNPKSRKRELDLTIFWQNIHHL
jgi:hypothetical protein